MNILNSDIVSVKYDAMWNDVSGLVAGATTRPILILVHHYEQNSMEQVQLQKMLEACKLVPEQYNIIKLEPGTQVAWHKLREQLDPKIIFLIGILPVQLGISALFRLNEPNKFNDRIWLATISITEQEQHPEMKKQLWISGMKPVFVDKSFGTF